MPNIAPRCAVLIIDDNPDDREFYRRALARYAHYEVAEASDGGAGLDRLGKSLFDCVLLDYSLPGASGLEILRSIRALDAHLAVIMLTGRGDIDIAVNALKEGASDYLTKAPELATRLDHVIHMAVDGAANARRAERSQRYLREMLDHIPDPIFMKDEGYHLVDGNTAFWTFMEGEADDFMGRGNDQLFVPSLAAAMTQAESATFRSGKVSVEEERWTDAAGEDRFYLTKRGVFRDQEDRKLLVGVMHDVTEERKVDRMKGEFISTVSHELRTPLTSIRGVLGLMTQSFAGALTPAGTNMVEIAVENCERLTGLIDDILDIDKIARGDMRFDVACHEVGDLIDHALRANQPYAEKFGVILTRGSVPERCGIAVDETRAVQILSNFLSNAVKFSEEGGEVSISAQKNRGTVRISVTDRGSGIPEDFRERIFERFAQADSSTARAKNGSGLGLHISRQLTEAMGGEIGFESEVGAGTTFWIAFPADRTGKPRL